MLIAKISPSATFTTQSGPFAQPETITADYLAAMARPYVAGAAFTNFEVQFGTHTPAVQAVEASGSVEAVQGQPARFQRIQSTQVRLSAQELANWGTDDSVLLEAIATKLGTSVVETVVVEENHF
jgi:hypothetical protein